MAGKYDDLLHLPHHVSKKHPPMKPQERAAQFAPFAALTGFGAAVRETARETVPRRELGEDEKAALDRALRTLRERLPELPAAALTYFVPDAVKDGGAYRTAAGRVCRLLPLPPVLVLEDGTRVPVADLSAVRLL